jgi:hypothetical protein
MMTPPKKWTIATARKDLPTLIRSAAREPQHVYRRDTLVATVVSPSTAGELEAPNRRARLAEKLDELRQLCAAEGYELPAAKRKDRNNPLARRSRKK